MNAKCEEEREREKGRRKEERRKENKRRSKEDKNMTAVVIVVVVVVDDDTLNWTPTGGEWRESSRRRGRLWFSTQSTTHSIEKDKNKSLFPLLCASCKSYAIGLFLSRSLSLC
jgi:hypothetical protein